MIMKKNLKMVTMIVAMLLTLSLAFGAVAEEVADGMEPIVVNESTPEPVKSTPAAQENSADVIATPKPVETTETDVKTTTVESASVTVSESASVTEASDETVAPTPTAVSESTSAPVEETPDPTEIPAQEPIAEAPPR